MFTPLKIQELRQAMGLSVQGFAAVFRVHRETVYSWERGDSHPRYKIMLEMNRLRNELEQEAVGS